MYSQFIRQLRNTLVVIVLLSLQWFGFPATSFAQDGGITFEQAQTRATFARKQMQKSRRELKDAEAREEQALRELADLQKRQVKMQKAAEQATQERQVAEEKYQEAQDKWSRETERLKRIHQRNNMNRNDR